MQAALRATRMKSKKGSCSPRPSRRLAAMGEEADDGVCLEDHAHFGAIGFFYRDFRQISDEEGIETLKPLSAEAKATEAVRCPSEATRCCCSLRASIYCAARRFLH